jgi:hypothetical protein
MKKLMFFVLAMLLTACVSAQFKYDLVVEKAAPMLYLNGTGSQIKFYGGMTITQGTGKLLLAGGNFDFGANSIFSTGSLGATGAGKLTKIWTVDAEFSNVPTINGVPMSSTYATIVSPSFTTGITTPAITLGSTLITTTGPQLNYLNTATSDIQTQIGTKQATLVSGTNIKTVGGITLLGSGDIPIAGTGTVTSVAVTTANGVSASIANPTSAANMTFSLGAITPTTVNTITLSGSSTPTLAVTGTSAISGTNTGDNAVNSSYSSLVSNATHTGDATGDVALTIANNAVTLAKMATIPTGYLFYRKTTGTGIPEVQSLATLKADLGLTGTNTGDQTNITGNAGTATILQTARTINGISFNGSANITVPSNIAPGISGNVMVSNGSVWTSGSVIGSGSGSVTNVGVTSANGVSAVVTNPTSTPQMTFSLGAITPTTVNSVAISGSSTPTLVVTGASSISGANTGNNAVNTLYSGLVSNATHTGQVTGATALTIAAGTVTLANMANMATASLIYRKTAGAGAPEVNTLATLKTDLGLTGTNSGDQTTITGNAGSATVLQTARTINGTSFNGSANITVVSNIAPGSSGNVMQSNGSAWTSDTPTELAVAIPTLTGVRMPQLSTTAINAISAPAAGLMVYDITLNVMKFWNGSVWKTILSN